MLHYTDTGVTFLALQHNAERQETELLHVAPIDPITSRSEDGRHLHTLRKHGYSNILKILQPKMENFQIKNSDMFIFLLKT